MFFIELETERLFLKNIAKKDRYFIFVQFSNDEINKYLFDAEPVVKIQDADEIIDFYTQPEPRGQHRWILVKKDDGVSIGTCGFHCWDKATGCCEAGYDLFSDYWGRGYMNEAMRAILDFARDDMEIHQINANIYPDNEKSVKLAEKLGFIYTGRMKDYNFRGKKYQHKNFCLDFTV